MKAFMKSQRHFCVKSAYLLLLVGAGACPSSWAADDGKALFTTVPPRQGPYLAGVAGRKAGKIENFPYSNGLKAATFDWTPERLDQWITDPQSVIADSYMMYKQADPAIRSSIIGYLVTLKTQ